MLSAVIEQELFDVRFVVNDMIIAHICDELEKYSIVVDDVFNNDLAVTFVFHRDTAPIIQGELRIDRILKEYGIVATCDGWLLLPARGNWQLVHEYLCSLFNE